MHDGKKGSTLKQELKGVFKELECGALECLTCGFAVSATELVERMEKDSGVGMVGVLSSHRQSSQHKAAVAMLKKANEPPMKGPLYGFFPTVAWQQQQQHQIEPPASSGPPRQHGRERDAAAAAAAGAEGNSRIEEAALHELVDDLSHADKHALVLHLSKKLLPCEGMGRPEAVGGKPDLTLHVPLSLFYKDGQYHRTKKQYVGRLVEVRQGSFHSTECTGYAEPDKQRCEPCLRITAEKYLEQHLQHLGKKWKDLPSTLNDAHFSFAQMVEKKEHLSQKLDVARLQTLTATRKAHAKEQALGQHQRILLLLSDRDANDRLLLDALAQALKARRSPQAVLAIVTSCYKGLYTPRPGYTERDIAVGTLLLRFGGAAAIYAAHKELRLPSNSYLRKLSQLAPFEPVIYTGLRGSNYFQAVKTAVKTNLIRSFTDLIASGQGAPDGFWGGWMMLADGVFTNGRPRYHHGTGAVIGGCEHVPLEVSLVLNTPTDGEAIIKALVRGQEEPVDAAGMHLAREANVYAFMPISTAKENTLFFPAAAIPTCNKRIPLAVVEEQVRAALAGFNEAMACILAQGGGPQPGKVVVLATDGDGKRRQVVTRLCNIEKGKLDVEDMLKDMILFDLYGGELEISVDFDMRHMIKRIRCRIIFTNKGMQLSPLGPKLDKITVQNIFDQTGVSFMASVFDSTDKQNVPAAVNLLAGMATAVEGFGPGCDVPKSTQADVRVLAGLGAHLLLPMLGGVDRKGKAVSLRDALVSMAAASFLLFVIYKQMGTAFIPSQLYHDLQDTIKGLFVMVARQLKDPKNKGVARLNFFLLGTNELEKLFGTLRRTCPGLVFDLLQLLERIKAAAEVQSIYAKNPDLDPGSRRLNGSTDKVNGKSWRGEVEMEGDASTLPSLWREGSALGLEVLDAHPFYGAKEGGEVSRARALIQDALERGDSMMRLLGKLVGVSEKSGGDLREGEEEEEEACILRSEPVVVQEEGEGEEEGEREEEAVFVEAEEQLRASREEERRDALVEAGEGDKARKGVFKIGEGEAVPKAAWLAKALVQQGVALSKLSADRTRRVQGLAKDVQASGVGAGGKAFSPADADAPMVCVYDPVLIFVSLRTEATKDHTTAVITTKAIMGVGVAEITTLQNKGVGKGLLACMPEAAFASAETVVEVRLLKVVGASGMQGVLELRRGHYITQKPLQLKGGQFIGLLKPDVVMEEVVVMDSDSDHEQQTKKTAVMQIDVEHLEERADLFAQEVEGRLHGLKDGARLLPKADALRLLPEDVTRELVVRKEKDEAVLTCLLCSKKNERSEMARAAMRQHVAGHLLLGRRPVSGCGFCGVDLVEGGCIVEVEGGVLLSNCSYRLSSFKYQPKNKEREDALAKWLTESEESRAAATREALMGKGAQVLNFPIKCPVQACGKVIWKYNLIPHLLDTTNGSHPVPGGSRCQPWRQRGKALLLKVHEIISSPTSRVHGRSSRDLKPEAAEEAAGLLGEVRRILRDQPNIEDGLRVAFCLEEIVSESKPAISYYHSKKGPHATRKSAPRTNRGSGRGSSTEEGTADRASSAAAGGGDAGESGEEDEEEEEEEEGLESEKVAGGKRGGGDQGVRSGGKRRK